MRAARPRSSSLIPHPSSFILSKQRLLRKPPPKRRRRQFVIAFVQPESARGDIEERFDLVGEEAFSATAHAPFRIVEFSSSKIAHAVEHLLFAIGEMFIEPTLEQRRHGPRQSQNDFAR